MQIILSLLSNYFVINIQVIQSRHCTAQNMFLLISTVYLLLSEAIKILISFYFASTFTTRPYQALLFLRPLWVFMGSLQDIFVWAYFSAMSQGCFLCFYLGFAVDTYCRQQVKSSQYKSWYSNFQDSYYYIRRKEELQKACIEVNFVLEPFPFQHLRRCPSWQGAVNKSKAITRWRCWWSITSLPAAAAWPWDENWQE